MQTTIASAVVHDIPSDVLQLLQHNDTTCASWNSLTPLARNEWICWIIEAKQTQTRERRLDRLKSDLAAGKRRPCCWQGCNHRKRNGKA